MTATIEPRSKVEVAPRRAPAPGRRDRHRAARRAGTPGRGGRPGGRGAGRGQALAQGPGQPPGVAHRQGQGPPAGQPAELDDGRRHRRVGHHARRRGPSAPAARPPGTSTTGRRRAAPVRAGARPAATVSPRSWTSRVSDASTSSAAAGSSAEVGSSRTRTLGEAVSTAPMATRCCWPPERVVSGRCAELVQAEEVQGVLHPPPHGRRGDAQVLHGVGELVLDGVGDEAGRRVLADHADHVGQLPRREVAGGAAVDHDLAGQPTAREVGYQAVDGPQQGGLARAGRADDHAQLALLEVQVERRGSARSAPA